MSVIEEIAAERRRQIEHHGYKPEHDDARHPTGALAVAGAAYALAGAAWIAQRRALAHVLFPDGPSYPPRWWPFHGSYWKPRDSRRDLVRAGALIVAEIERLDRAADPRSLSSDP